MLIGSIILEARMVWLRRISLFIALNFAVMVTIGFLLWILGADRWLQANGLNIRQLLVWSLVWGMGGSFISLALSRIMAKWTMGVQVIDRATATGESKALLDLVDDLCRKANLKGQPEVGIYRSPELNAFATGPSQRRALVAVSSGLLQRMKPEELRAVLGHEVTHVANGDMITMTLLQGIVNAFVLFLSRALAYALVLAGRRDGERASGASFGIVSFVLQILFMILGSLLIAAYSRWREFRADRGGAQLAGRDAMISALQTLEQTSKIQDPAHDQATVAAFKISSPSSIFRLWATHPPIEERVARLRGMEEHRSK